MENTKNNFFRFAIDRGGTFTDIYAEVPGKPGFRILKLLSENPEQYVDAPWEGIRRILEDCTGKSLPESGFDTSSIQWVRLGTTLATNALLERKGARTAILITKGFGDLLSIGKQNRPKLFDLNIKKPEPIYDSVLEVDERIRVLKNNDNKNSPKIVLCKSGDYIEILKKPDENLLKDSLLKLLEKGIESLAIVFMHSYVYPDHEEKIGILARQLGFKNVSLSSQVMPRIKIVDRGQTCALDAYLTPKIREYLNAFQANLNKKNTELFFMQSDGGLVTPKKVRGSHSILSGPAGGIIGYAKTLYNPKQPTPIIGFDMGGTSTDVSRFDGQLEWTYETEKAGVHIQSPQLDINTVAAGGGSRLFFNNGMFQVGPESSGANPGPVCYRKNGWLSITDANLFLGRIAPEFFPKIFGPQNDEPLDLESTKAAIIKVRDEINESQVSKNLQTLNAEQVALGFIQVANEIMARSIREITVARGHDVRNHVLACFGGAGGQHACSLAKSLGIGKVLIHRFAGILSAYGLALANVVVEKQVPVSQELKSDSFFQLNPKLEELENEAIQEIMEQGAKKPNISCTRFLNLRYEGTDTQIMISEPKDHDFLKAFKNIYSREFGFDLNDRKVWIDDIRVRAEFEPSGVKKQPLEFEKGITELECITQCYFENGWLDTQVYLMNKINPGDPINGPAILISDTSTVIIEPGCVSKINQFGDVEIDVPKEEPTEKSSLSRDPIQLAIISNKFMSIAEQMGRTLQRTAISTNIKERQDFSCAIFDPKGNLVANAPHQPVHLGSMGEAIRSQIKVHGDSMKPGDVYLSNHPKVGGTHLPDLTVITPVMEKGKPIFFVASRGHHADIGGISPGSMPPFSSSIEEEGAAILSFKLLEKGEFQEEKVKQLLLNPQKGGLNSNSKSISGARAVNDNISDLRAQVAANERGKQLLMKLIADYSLIKVHRYMSYIQDAAEESVRTLINKTFLKKSGKNKLVAKDFLDDGTHICLSILLREDGSADFDFSGTGVQVAGNLNAPISVTHSAILYCLRCLVDNDIPLNQGCLNPVSIHIPENSILSPSQNAAVAAGNVLTSQRIVDVIFKAFGAMAASQGCMNNLTFGNESFGYYETIGGGAGAGPNWDGASGVHTHMTNTRITDPEILEKRYPVLLREFSIRKNSGGKGLHFGGDGLIREFEFLEPLQLAVLTERRNFSPFGLMGGEPGLKGKNIFIKKGEKELILGSKSHFQVGKGDRIRILTPGGGGFGKPGC